MHPGRDAFKSFTIFTGMRLPFFSRLREFFRQTLFFSSVNICSMILMSRLWAGLSFNTVKSLLCYMWSVARSYVMLKKIYLHSILISNCLSASGCIWHNLSYHQFWSTILNHHFLYIPKESDFYLQTPQCNNVSPTRLHFEYQEALHDVKYKTDPVFQIRKVYFLNSSFHSNQPSKRDRKTKWNV